MKYEQKVMLKNGKEALIRNCTGADGSAVLDVFTLAHEQTDYLLSYPDENFELDQYLHTLPFNYDYLRKLFKSEVGVTPHQFLSDTRLQAAAERLSFTEGRQVNISEIAHLCGFREPLYFSKIFRKKYGMSPSQYQRSQRENTSVPDGESLKIRTDA